MVVKYVLCVWVKKKGYARPVFFAQYPSVAMISNTVGGNVYTLLLGISLICVHTFKITSLNIYLKQRAMRKYSKLECTDNSSGIIYLMLSTLIHCTNAVFIAIYITHSREEVYINWVILLLYPDVL